VLKKLKNSPKSNIVKLYSSFEDNEYIYFLMEYIDGGDFWTYLANHRTSSFLFPKIYQISRKTPKGTNHLLHSSNDKYP